MFKSKSSIVRLIYHEEKGTFFFGFEHDFSIHLEER